ncbi:MAG: phenylalanine--tRNA ligase beta subunit-related protein [Bacteroidota bacterium]
MTRILASAQVVGARMIVQNHLPPDTVTLGLLYAEGVEVTADVPSLDDAIARAIAERQAEPDEAAERTRQAARNMLRNGRYKPTGRGKPASEYLAGVVTKGKPFPRINALVDTCNLISLASGLPISIWDVDRAGTARFVFRLGAEGEEYVFNNAGQSISLHDLVCGCRVLDSAMPLGMPCVNPVRDSMATKTTDASTCVAAAIYAPATWGDDRLEALCARFSNGLRACGSAVTVRTALAQPQATASLA